MVLGVVWYVLVLSSASYNITLLLQKFNNCARHARSQTADTLASSSCYVPWCELEQTIQQRKTLCHTCSCLCQTTPAVFQISHARRREKFILLCDTAVVDLLVSTRVLRVHHAHTLFVLTILAAYDFLNKDLLVGRTIQRLSAVWLLAWQCDG